MKERIEIENLPKENVFKVAENYFEELPDFISKKISFEGKLSKKSINFEIPTGYFEDLSDKILTRINQEEKQKISLENLPKTNVFKIKEGYFDSFEKEILAETINKKQGKVVKVNWWQSSRVLWSAAAAVASVVLLIGFLWIFVPKQSDTEAALKEVSKEEISKYLENQDLSLLEYEAVELSKSNIQNTDNQLLQHIELNDRDILEHLENEEIEEI